MIGILQRLTLVEGCAGGATATYVMCPVSRMVVPRLAEARSGAGPWHCKRDGGMLGEGPHEAEVHPAELPLGRCLVIF